MASSNKDDILTQKQKDEDRVKIYPVKFKRLDPVHPPTSNGNDENIRFLKDILLEIKVELGTTKLTMGHVANLDIGQIIKINRGEGEPIDILVDGEIIAEGEVLVVGDQLAAKVTSIISG